MLSTTAAFIRVPAVLVLLACAVTGCGGDRPSVLAPALPQFRADRTNPAPNDFYLEGFSVDSETLVLQIVSNWQNSGPPHEMFVQLRMPIASLEPLSMSRGDGWPEFTHPPDLIIEQLIFVGADTWRVVAGFSDISTACAFCPATFETGPITLATVTVRIKESGTFRIELEPTPPFPSNMIWCGSCDANDLGFLREFDLFPTFGGTVEVP